LNKNLVRGFKDLSLFEIGPIFLGSEPGEQQTVVSGLRTGKLFRQSWAEQERLVDVFDVKRDVIQSLVEAGYNKDKFYVDDETPNYYHPGKSGRIFLNKGKEKVVAFFGDIHPNILKKLDIKVDALVGFEIFLENIKQTKKSLKNQKTQYKYSDFQKSERDFAFILDKNFKVQELIDIITNIDKDLIKSVKVFDVYEGTNIAEGKKSIALNVTIQSLEKTLNEEDLNKINKLIISTVEKKIDAKIRS
jgi:phenylalanyl-tRNA synthetase beta chain